MDIKKCITKKKQTLDSLKQLEVHLTIDKQRQNHRLKSDSRLSHRGGGGLDAFTGAKSSPKITLLLKHKIVSLAWWLPS